MHDSAIRIPSHDLWIFNPKHGPKMLGEYSHLIQVIDQVRSLSGIKRPKQMILELTLSTQDFVGFMEGHENQSRIYLWCKAMDPMFWYIDWTRTTWRNERLTGWVGWVIRLRLMEIRHA